MWFPATLSLTSFALTFALMRDALYLFRYRNEKSSEMQMVTNASFNPHQSMEYDSIQSEAVSKPKKRCNPFASVWSFLFERKERKSPDIYGTRVVGRRMLLVFGLAAFGYVLANNYI